MSAGTAGTTASHSAAATQSCRLKKMLSRWSWWSSYFTSTVEPYSSSSRGKHNACLVFIDSHDKVQQRFKTGDFKTEFSSFWKKNWSYFTLSYFAFRWFSLIPSLHHYWPSYISDSEFFSNQVYVNLSEDAIISWICTQEVLGIAARISVSPWRAAACAAAWRLWSSWGSWKTEETNINDIPYCEKYLAF